MPDNMSKVMITTRNNTTVSNIILFVGDNVISQVLVSAVALVASFITCVRPYVLFSKSMLNIRTRLVVTVESETKWMPNSDSASKRMPKCKILVQYDRPNYFYSCLKIAVF